MRFKLSKELCYIAGLAGRTHEPARSQVGIITMNGELVERFIQYALRLGVDSKKIMVEGQESTTHVYFYHSKISRMIKEVLEQRASLPKKKREMAIAFIAGTFDAGGHVTGGRVSINRLDKADELLLELLGVHTVNSRILNIREFFSVIKSQSLLAGSSKLNF